ncbi:hypothetical protein ABEF92_003407 [Exophiala dermatitidis]|uniref:Major facilitator superfamily (MFS) profile domain-containing protein n=1 Tax=Exophiala dermatitidis (strain ATCC 34100 / CBS 525.76 / NIH/UT8656) TaxID=858893 RepID=H6BZJ4_EXODN|nr:uncharacterized protein HMPREF1120_05107 [Exophiala dermatitidis NIH/UT8656]EHY57057.1 hypothetical protein HMPREF1120_05107 [Exophiala dermatitidis NIH/UT8656]
MATEDSLGREIEDAPAQLPSETESAPLLGPKNYADDLDLGKMIWASPGLILGIILSQADIGLESAVFPKIASEFHQFRHVALLTIGFSFSIAAGQPVYSRLSDRYGRKPLLLGSYCWFFIGVILCPLSSKFWMLVLARGIVGIGTAGMGYIVSLIITDIVPVRNRAIWQSGIDLVTFLGRLAGGTLGGVVVERLGWQSAFAMEAPLALVALLAVSLSLKLPPLPTQSTGSGSAGSGSPILHDFDAMGAVLLLIFVACAICGFGIAGYDVFWNSPAVAGLLGASILFAAIFVWYEHRVIHRPLIPIRNCARRPVWPILLVTFFKDMAFTGMLFVIPIYVNVSARGESWTAGLLNALLSLGAMIGAAAIGFRIRNSGRLWGELVAGASLALIAGIATSLTWNGSESFAVNMVEILLFGIGYGMALGTTLVAVLHFTEFEERAAIYGVVHLLTAIATLVALGIFGALFSSRAGLHMRLKLDGASQHEVEKLSLTSDSYPLPQCPRLIFNQIVQRCLDSLECLSNMSPQLQNVVRQSFVESIHDSLLGIACLLGAMFLASTFCVEANLL